MTMEMAEARGTVTVRPWRVGLLVDTRSPVEVREAIASLSSVWGGRSMPIFDINTPIPKLEKLGEVFGVDSLYAEVTEGPLAEFLRKPGWAWRGRAQWGPFGSEDNGTFRKGLLPIKELLHEASQLTVPCWSAEDPNDLAFAAIWGLPDKVGTHHDPVPYTDLFTTRPASMVGLGILASTMLHIHPDRPTSRGSQDGIFILHAEQSENIVKFWNMRAVGGSVLGIPSDAAPELADALLNQPLPGSEMGVVGPQGVVSKRNVLHVFGGAKSSIEVTKAIERAAGATHEVREGRPQEPQFLFSGLRTDFRRTLRVEFRPASQGIDVDLPRLLLVSKPSHVFRRGIVAAEVKLGEVRGQDPRYTGHVPPYRRHAALLENRQRHQSVDHVRSGHDGLVFGLDVGYEELHVPFANTQEVIRLLFDSESVEVGQSNVGKFQTRAAEKFGGPYSGTFNQPGVRAAVTRAAGKPAGVPLDYLRGMVEKERGSWPDSPTNHSMAPRDYAIRAVNNLFHGGLFVPTLRVHCSHCRVESHVSADDLGTTMNCEFCGQVYNLALSQALSQPEWRYRLAAHLRPDQIEALLPALATTSLLQQLRHTSDLPPLALGLEVTVDGRKIEADIAAYLGDRDWLAVLGEVKTGNRIDSKDIANLEFLRARLVEKEVRCLLLFATLKDEFSPEERQDLRALVERSAPIRSSIGQSTPNFPLVLTAPDLSRHFWDEEHPWRWEKKSYNGILDTALVSCERNLGLTNYSHNQDTDGPSFTFGWAD